METPTLLSKRLRLRPILIDDVEFIYELFSRSETNKYSEYPDLKTRDEAVEMYDKFMRPGGESRFRVIIERLGESIGTIGMYSNSKDHKRAEIGYDLMREHWGNGYMTEAVEALVSYGFETLGLERIEATVDPENGASIRILEKNSFQHEGTLRKRFHYKGG
ncbi:GNAT family N-acetyltransferase [Candidatus Bathyarchaeota archaeon]|jgi:[ribosomal protein S5]-alanine N-acetyltransferase|nr:GNAT family N-acetyltransferase [Candidatus Bathyarchaeota archaeon]MBT4319407.1 GNAT family N-acetyltransferase [Candidatus Bathyarchaeota archaeon]MBT4424723.1 GNAT family N-acetyltransferase [Candidatus Bathyarchaeota archaeon]MBT5641877.1 GNAT family N-acetyltransferase [Candidatus Bathyarchaeota archaeon]MBT7187149.1 GNAT family N-acetyltransferase [Candidatus Bathyarchaeota archaeon]